MKLLKCKTLEDFYQHFRTDWACHKYFEEMRFGKKTVCPHCLKKTDEKNR